MAAPQPMPGEVQTFHGDPGFARMNKLFGWVFVAVGVSCLGIPFLEHGPASSATVMAVSALGAIFFGLLGWYTLRIAGQVARHSISLDNEGLWYEHLPKERTFVRWPDVRSMRERWLLQRLDLVDGEGRVVFKVEYQLAGFERLRSLLVEKTLAGPAGADPRVLAKGLLHHVLVVGAIAAFAAAGLYASLYNVPAAFLAAAIAAYGAYEYATTICRVELLPDRLRLGFPLRTLDIPRAEIEAVAVFDEYNKAGMRHPAVAILLQGRKKPFALKNLGVAAVTLHAVLERWRQRASDAALRPARADGMISAG